jgi:hypothetical protein
MRLAVGVVALIALGACEKPPAPTAPAAAVTPAPAPAPAENPGSAPDTRIGALAMTCGGEAFRVAFERGRAVIVGPDGSNMELKLLEPQPGAPQNVRTYTNGVSGVRRCAQLAAVCAGNRMTA